jgi:hypothetical protein
MVTAGNGIVGWVQIKAPGIALISIWAPFKSFLSPQNSFLKGKEIVYRLAQ